MDAIKAFLLEQIRDPVQKVTSLEQLNDLTHADRRTKSQVKTDFGEFFVIFGQFSLFLADFWSFLANYSFYFR